MNEEWHSYQILRISVCPSVYLQFKKFLNHFPLNITDSSDLLSSSRISAPKISKVDQGDQDDQDDQDDEDDEDDQDDHDGHEHQDYQDDLDDQDSQDDLDD